MLHLHVFAYIACAHLCISKFASKMLCGHYSMIAKVNSRINFNFCIAEMNRLSTSPVIGAEVAWLRGGAGQGGGRDGWGRW